MQKKKIFPKIKSNFHVRNKHRKRYDFDKLIDSFPKLKEFVVLNKFGDKSIDFSDPKAVLILNKALLKFHYGIDNWDIPQAYLCPPIPGRADYIHYVADLIYGYTGDVIPKGKSIKCLDIGVGANCIYPIIGSKEYGWEFVGTDIDPVSIDTAKKIVANNSSLNELIEFRYQNNPSHIFKGIIKEKDSFNLSICNPPFHSSKEEAFLSSQRKVSNLKNRKINKPILNFSGQSNELWCDGGEKKFIRNMIFESRDFSESVHWFTTLVSKKSSLNSIYNALKKVNPTDVRTISMGQGNKISRIVAWTYMPNKKNLK